MKSHKNYSLPHVPDEVGVRLVFCDKTTIWISEPINSLYFMRVVETWK